MFGKLPELFNEKYAIGYFLPATAFILSSFLLLYQFALLPAALIAGVASQVDIFIGTTLLGLVSWLMSILLLATNRDIVRLMEGYGRYNPLRLFSEIEKRRYRRLKEAILELDKQYLFHASEKREFPLNLRLQRNRLIRELVERFPDAEYWLLPTSFGNTIRAFEVYPRVMYGLDSIPGWYRLLSVVPEGYRSFVDSAKAQVDFWINLCFLSLIL